MPKKYPDLGARIIANSALSLENFYNGSPCWEWLGKRSADGYPYMTMRWRSGPRKGKVHNVGAHREALKFFRGFRMRKNYVGMHLCNNRACVNPMHLANGSQSTNIQQCVREGRHKTPFRRKNHATD